MLMLSIGLAERENGRGDPIRVNTEGGLPGCSQVNYRDWIDLLLPFIGADHVKAVANLLFATTQVPPGRRCPALAPVQSAWG